MAEVGGWGERGGGGGRLLVLERILGRVKQ